MTSSAAKPSTTIQSATREQKLNAVLASPAAVNAKDRAAWVGIFARYSTVEDPVGSQPHSSGGYDHGSGLRGHGALERFFDTFIAPNEITFHVDRDVICGDHVIRDLTIEIKMAEQVVVKVPMHLLYELTDEACELTSKESELRISHLAAHWEAWPMVKQVLSKGVPAYKVLCALGWRMMRIQGLGGALGFSKGFLGIGKTGKEAIEYFVSAINSRNTGELVGLFEPLNLGIHLPYGQENHGPMDVLDHFNGQISVSKLISSGYSATATLVVTDDKGEKKHGVAMFDFHGKTKKIHEVRLYWDEKG